MAAHRLREKLDNRLANNDFYEAHQIYRTIFFRLKRERKYHEAYDLLYEGSIKLLDQGQYNSGADLANLLVDLLSGLHSINQVVHTEHELVDSIWRLFEKIPPNSPEREQFVGKVLQISFLPTTVIRQKFAQVLWKEQSYAEARLHFVYSSDSGDNCALMLIEYQTTRGYPYEADLMIAQFVLQVLCIKNKPLADQTFYHYTLHHPQIQCSKPPYVMPLLNFIFFLLVAIEQYSEQSNVFTRLCSLYEKSLNRDPSYQEYLSQIGQIYFGLEQKKQGGGLFTDLLQSLFEPKPESLGGSGHGSTFGTQAHSSTTSASTTTTTNSAQIIAKTEDVELD